MKYFKSIKKDTFVSKFAYIFLALFSLSVVACESDNADNPLATSSIIGYVSDTNYWYTTTPSVVTSGRDSLGRDTVLTIQAFSSIDQSELYMFIPFPKVGSFNVASVDSTGTLAAIRYEGSFVPSGTITITRFDTLRYVLEAEFNFSFEGTVAGDSGAIDTTNIEFTKGKIKAAYLRR